MKLIAPPKKRRIKPVNVNRCATPFCQRIRRKDNKSRYCHTCNSRMQDLRHPARRCYRNLKSHAKERGIEFALTFAEFEEFAIKYDYLNRRGRHATGFVIDRRNNLKGYVRSNLQCLTNRDNVIKQATVDKIRTRRGMFVDMKIMAHKKRKSRR